MGGTSSSDKRRQIRGGIYILLQKTGFISNDTVTGVLHINLEEPFKGHLLQITLEGKEETFYTYIVYSGGKQRRRRRVRVQGFNTIISFSLPIYDFAPQNKMDNFVLQPGQWTIPFSLKIADSLPSSMSFIQEDSLAKCSLVYKLQADIISNDSSVTSVSGSQEIFIGQQVNIMTQLLSLSLHSQPRQVCCCCISSGEIKLQASTDKYCYSPNEIINVTINCDFNNFTKEVLSLNVSLKGNLTLKSQKTPRIHQTESYRLQKALPIQNKRVETQYQIVVPNNIPLSTNGQLINLSYSIEIVPIIDSCCITKNDPLNLQIIINPTSNTLSQLNQFPLMAQIQQPQIWKPTQLQQVQFSEQQSFNYYQQQAKFKQQQEQLYLEQMDQDPNDISMSQQPTMKQLNQPFL